MKAIALLAFPVLAHADVCENAVTDPIATPLRETDLQRGACLRDELSTSLTGHALVDTDNFHGILGGDLAIGGRVVVRDRVELGARVRIVDYTFVQTAVNKVTAVRVGPLSLGAAFALPFDEHADLAVVTAIELPYTRDQMDTLRSSGHLQLALSGRLSTRWQIHARFGGMFAIASSSGGESYRFALRAGSDLAWRFRARWSLLAGVDSEGGWRDGFSTLLVRAGLAWRPCGGAYRTTLGIGAPVFGDEPTNAIVSFGVARDLD